MKPYVVIAAMAGVAFSTNDALAVPFGLFWSVSDQAQLAPLTTLGVSELHGDNPGSIQQRTSSGAIKVPDINLHVGPAAFGTFSVELRGGSSASGVIADGRLHGGVKAYGPDVIFKSDTGPETTRFSTSFANLYELWMDTLHVNGPAGSTVQFKITNHFSGLVSATGAGVPFLGDEISALSFLSLSGVSCAILCSGGGLNQSYKELPGSFFNEADSFLVSADAGSDLSLELQVVLNAIAGDIYAISESSAAAFDTNWLTIDILTPGASITSASGLSYRDAPPGAAPEPATLVLLALGLAGLGFTRRRKQ